MRKGACFWVVLWMWMVLAGISSMVLAQELTSEETGKAGKATTEAASLEPIVVTSDRMETPVSEVTKSISVVSTKDRDEQQNFYLPDLIGEEPGVFVRQNGGPGQLTNISIRGAGSQHTQFQYNGFPLRDTADTQSTLQYFIEDMYSGTNLKQVEVLRGTQSTLYGSQAMGGVINIVPEKWKKGFGAELRSEFGSHMTYTGNGRAYYGNDTFYVDVNPVGVHTNGLKNGGPNDYYYNNIGYTAGAGVKLSNNMVLDFSSILYATDVALSSRSPSLTASGNLVPNLASADSHREGLLAQNGLSFTQQVSPLWDYSVKAAYTAMQRHYIWSQTSGNQSNYDGSNIYCETQQNLHLTDWFTLMVGADGEGDYYNGKEPRNPSKGNYNPVYYNESYNQVDLFTQALLKFLDESLFINLGARLVNPSAFSTSGVGEASAAYLIKPFGTKIHAALGSGYRIPSLYEIYGGYVYNGQLITIGNPNLTPENSMNYEVGVDQSFLDKKLTLGATWFHTDFNNLITYDGFKNQYVNAQKGRTSGVETYFTVAPFSWLNTRLAYTYADSQYQANTASQWLRKEYIPRSQVSATLNVLPYEGLTTSFVVGWQGDRIVPLYTPTYTQVRWDEPGSVTVDMAVTYNFLKKYQVWFRASNLLNEDYTQGGYIMPGRWFYGGFKVTF